MNARADSRQKELGDGDQDAADTLVAYPEDLLAVYMQSQISMDFVSEQMISICGPEPVTTM